MTRRRRRQSREGSRVVNAGSRRGTPSRRRLVRWIPLALPFAAGLAFVDWHEVRAAPAPVRPADLGQLDPEIRSILEEHLESAAREPRSARNHGTLGLIYEANGMWTEAERSFRIAGELDPDEALWQLHRALALRELGDPRGARALLGRARDQDARSAPVHYHLGDLLLEAGRLDEAIDCFESAAALAPRQPEGHAALGAALLRKRSYAEAASRLEKAVALDPEYRTAHYLLGLAYRGLERDDEAQRELSRGVGAERRYFPDALSGRLLDFRTDYASQVDRAAKLLRSGKTPQAIPILEELRARRPSDVNVANNLAIAYKQRGEMERALELLESAKRSSPEQFPTWINLAACLLDTGRLGDALAHADRAIALAPEIGTGHLVRGQILARQGRLPEAHAAAATCVRLDARNPEAHVLLGKVCAALGRFEEARSSLEAAVRVAPDHAPAHIDLCRVWLELGRLDEAERALATARKLAPGDPAVAALARLVAQRGAARR